MERRGRKRQLLNGEILETGVISEANEVNSDLTCEVRQSGMQIAAREFAHRRRDRTAEL
jgi:hypothetical protein